jgi:hypothetical protein
LMPIAFLSVHLLECKMHAQNTACGQRTKDIDGFNLNGMEKYTCKVSSQKIEAAMPYNQNLCHFPSFVTCSTNALRNSIVIGTKRALICFLLYYLQFLGCRVVIFALSLSGPVCYYMVLAADRHLKKICS